MRPGLIRTQHEDHFLRLAGRHPADNHLNHAATAALDENLREARAMTQVCATRAEASKAFIAIIAFLEAAYLLINDSGDSRFSCRD